MPPKRKLKPRSKQLAALGAAIEQARRELDLTQEELAHKSNVHTTHLSALERGARNPTYRTICQIAEKGLGITPGQLVGKADKFSSRGRKDS